MKFAISILGWLLTPIIFLLWISIALMPESRALRMARPLGTIIRKGSRNRTIHKMKSVLDFQDWSNEQWTNLWMVNAEQAALMFIEGVHFYTMPLDEVHSRISVEGEEFIREALQVKRGVMVFVNHLGNMACTVGELAIRGFDMTLAGNKIPIPFLEQKLRKIHERVGANRVHIGRNLPQIAADVFHRNGVFATFIDVSISHKHTTWIQFGGAELRVNIAPAILALRHNVGIVSATCTRRPGNRHHVVIRPLTIPDTTHDLHADASRVMQQAIRHVEADLFRQPEQWWQWDHAPLRPRHSGNEAIV